MRLPMFTLFDFCLTRPCGFSTLFCYRLNRSLSRPKTAGVRPLPLTTQAAEKAMPWVFSKKSNRLHVFPIGHEDVGQSHTEQGDPIPPYGRQPRSWCHRVP
jgi:hypothetical protein